MRKTPRAIPKESFPFVGQERRPAAPLRINKVHSLLTIILYELNPLCLSGEFDLSPGGHKGDGASYLLKPGLIRRRQSMLDSKFDETGNVGNAEFVH
jgi:hypothetical protein